MSRPSQPRLHPYWIVSPKWRGFRLQVSDVLRGDDFDPATIAAGASALGNVLTNIGLISGLQSLLGAGVRSYSGGNIILGGDGSDLIEGRGGDDLIDGDKWLNVRISVRAI